MKPHNRSSAAVAATLFLAACGGAPSLPAQTSSEALTLAPTLVPPAPTPLPVFNSGWTDVGSPFGYAPALASWGPGRVDLFMKNGEQLIQKTHTSGGWAPSGDHYWYIASNVESDPSAVGWDGRFIDVVFRGAANNVVHVWWNGSTWTTDDLGGVIDGKPTISVAPDGSRMDVFARVGSSIWHRDWIAFRNGWNNWENLNLYTESDPVAVSWGRGHVDLFYRANDGETRRYSWDGSPWQQALAGQTWVTQPSLGGWARGLPAVATHGVGQLDVFVDGGDDGIYRNSLYTAGKFNGWVRVPGCTYGTPAAVVSDTLNLVVRDKNQHRILHNFETLTPSSAGTTPMCCGLLYQGACASNGCDPSLGYDAGMCVPCGGLNQPACINQPRPCQPAFGLDSDGWCRACADNTATYGGDYCRRPHILTTSRSLDGSIHVDVNVAATEAGGFAIHPHATNYNEVTGFMYTVECRVGQFDVAFLGHVGPGSVFNVSGPGRDDPGIRGIRGAALRNGWPTINADWGQVNCWLSTQSTLAQTMDQIWAAISGAYMKELGIDNLADGEICFIDCSSSDCPSDCAGDTQYLKSCSGPGDDNDNLGNSCDDYGNGLE